MASFWTTYARNKTLDHWLGGPDLSRPGTVYLGLMTAAPTIAGGGTETAVIGRLAVTNNATNFPAATSGAKRTGTTLTFTASAPSAIGTVVGIAMFDASVGGNMLNYGDLDTPRTVSAGAGFAVETNGGEFSYVETA